MNTMTPALVIVAGAVACEAVMSATRLEACRKPLSMARVKALAPGVDDVLKLPNVRAFLAVIRHGETSARGADAYRMINGGGLFAAPPWAHPGGSRAAGAYQFKAATWQKIAGIMGLKDFAPLNQDRAAVGYLAYLGALECVKAGNTAAAYRACNKGWTSLPGGAEMGIYGRTVNKADGALLTPAQAADMVFGIWGGRINGN